MRLIHTSPPRSPSKPPEFTAREFRDGSGWYVFVRWGDAPAEEIGHFETEAGAQEWIDQHAEKWLAAISEGSSEGPTRL